MTVTMVGMAATAVALLAAFDPLTEGIRNLHDSGNPANMRTPLATLAALLDRLGRYEPAATIAGFALSPLTSASVPEIATAMTTRRLRIRPNRPGPSRTERRLSQTKYETQKSVAAPCHQLAPGTAEGFLLGRR